MTSRLLLRAKTYELILSQAPDCQYDRMLALSGCTRTLLSMQLATAAICASHPCVTVNLLLRAAVACHLSTLLLAAATAAAAVYCAWKC
jgi:hypothetical protein